MSIIPILKMRENQNHLQPRNKYLAALMALFGGFFGLHKLYLKDAGGLMFYIFMIFMSVSFGIFPGLTAVFGVFDALKLIMMNDQTFNRKYNHGYVQMDGQIEKRRQQQMKNYEVKDTQRQPQVNIKSNPFKASAIAKYKDFDLDAAIDDFNKALEINSNDNTIHFNLACAYSMTEKKDKSFYHLSRAVELGFSDLDRIVTHDDLAYLRVQPEFDTFRKNGFKVSAQSQVGNANTQTSPLPTDDVLLAQLNRLAELRKRGILTEEEFLIERKKIMRS